MPIRPTWSAMFLVLLICNYVCAMNHDAAIIEDRGYTWINQMNTSQLLTMASLLYEQTFLCESVVGALYTKKISYNLSSVGVLANDIQGTLDAAQTKLKKIIEQKDKCDWEMLTREQRTQKIFQITIFCVLELLINDTCLEQMTDDFNRMPEVEEIQPLMDLVKVLQLFAASYSIDVDHAQNTVCKHVEPELAKITIAYTDVSDRAQELYAQLISSMRYGQNKTNIPRLDNRYFDRKLPLYMTKIRPKTGENSRAEIVHDKGRMSKRKDKEDIDALVRSIEGVSSIRKNKHKQKSAFKKYVQKKHTQATVAPSAIQKMLSNCKTQEQFDRVIMVAQQRAHEFNVRYIENQQPD